MSWIEITIVMASVGIGLVGDYILEILAALTISYILYQIKLHKMITKLEDRQRIIENALFGFEQNNRSNGYIDNSKNRMYNIEENIENIEGDISEIQKTLVRVETKLNDDKEDNN